MKVMKIQPRNDLFTGVLDTIAESLGRSPERTAILRANSASANAKAANAPFAYEAADGAPRKGWLARAGNWLWQREMRGVDAYVARADDTFAALDRWLWKQRNRETEAWLAKSQDLFELEARIRHLERGPQARIF